MNRVLLRALTASLLFAGGAGGPSINLVVTNTGLAGPAPFWVELDASGSTCSDPVNDWITAFTWTVSDGATGTRSWLDHTYASPGTYTVTVVATDAFGATATETIDVTATGPGGGGADAGPPIQLNVTNTGLSGPAPWWVELDASGSTCSDPVNDWITAFTWTVSDGTTGTRSWLDHTYASPGTYTVTVIATDAFGATATETIDVTATGPGGGGADGGGDAGVDAGADGGSGDGGLLDGGFPGGPPGLHVTYVDTHHAVLAVDPSGRVFGIDLDDPNYDTDLWVSTDDARTWTPLGQHPAGASYIVMTALASGTLLADCDLGNVDSLWRSADHGVSWQYVKTLSPYRWLQPHSVAQLGSTVFYGEYQVFQDGPTPIHVWASEDDGKSWTVRKEFTTYRHDHALIADPARGALWGLFGDEGGALIRSTDLGTTWTTMAGPSDGVAVDGVVLPGGGLLYGMDADFAPQVPGIWSCALDGTLASLAGLPGPSYAVLAAPKGGYLLGQVRQPQGDVYPPGDESSRLFGSPDGVAWTDLYDLPILDPNGWSEMDVHWILDSGEMVLQVDNVQGFGGTSGRGFVLFGQ